jgi:hypothetical protein
VNRDCEDGETIDPKDARRPRSSTHWITTGESGSNERYALPSFGQAGESAAVTFSSQPVCRFNQVRFRFGPIKRGTPSARALPNQGNVSGEACDQPTPDSSAQVALLSALQPA